MSEGEAERDDPPEEQSRRDVVLVADPSAEGENVALALRARGFSVVDVPIALLAARVAGEAPKVLVIALDQPGAFEALGRARDGSVLPAIELICIGDPAQAAELGVPAASGRVFERPIDIERLAREVSLLATPQDHVERGTTPPPSLAQRRETPLPLAPENEGDVLGGSDYPPAIDAIDVSSILPAAERSRDAPKLIHAEFSSDLQRILNAATERLGAEPGPASLPPAIDEVDFILSPELLASLDEPLDPEEEEDAGTGSGLESGLSMSQYGAFSRAGTASNVLSHPSTRLMTHDLSEDAPSRSSEAVEVAPAAPPPRLTPLPPGSATDAALPLDVENARGPRPQSDSPPATIAGSRAFAYSTRLTGVDPLPRVEKEEPPREPPSPARPAAAGSSNDMQVGAAAPRLDIPAVLREGDAALALARAISGRASGSLALNTERGVRRVVLQDGDVLTAGSGIADETLLSFLAARGDIERETAVRLVGKLPPFGRHAGAALIAHGHLGQDDLWPVLRAHAEWIIGRAVAEDTGTCELETEPPGRFKAEPSVFGGATGAEVFVETLRRVVSPELARERLGGASARLDDGRRLNLLGECALHPEEDEAVRNARGKTVAEVVANGEPELVTVLYACVSLEILTVLTAAGSDDARGPEIDPLDEEAIRQRVRARLALVEDADYFTLLGVGRGATGYEVRRAYLALRRSLEPSRLLTAKTADLLADLRLILEVLDEAYEILKEPHRRERYRRAIEAGSP